MIERYRASTERLTDQDELAAREIGWRMALCAAELVRPPRMPTIPLAGPPSDPRSPRARRRSSRRTCQRAKRSRVHLAATLRRGPPTGCSRQTIQRADAGRRDRAAGASASHRPRVDGPGHRAGDAGGRGGIHAGGAGRLSDQFRSPCREQESGLVAETLIAAHHETLFISEARGDHILNILGKLGVASRTEAATVAVRLKLDQVRSSRRRRGMLSLRVPQNSITREEAERRRRSSEVRSTPGVSNRSAGRLQPQLAVASARRARERSPRSWPPQNRRLTPKRPPPRRCQKLNSRRPVLYPIRDQGETALVLRALITGWDDPGWPALNDHEATFGPTRWQ